MTKVTGPYLPAFLPRQAFQDAATIGGFVNNKLPDDWTSEAHVEELLPPEEFVDKDSNELSGGQSRRLRLRRRTEIRVRPPGFEPGFPAISSQDGKPVS